MLKFKSILIPLDPCILKLYKGWMMNGEMLEGKTDLDIKYKKKIIQNNYKSSKAELISTIIFLLLFSPVLIIGLIISAILRKVQNYGNALDNILKHIFSIFPAPEKFIDAVRHYPEYKDAYYEDIPDFFEKCYNHKYIVFLYYFDEPNKEELEDIGTLITQGFIVNLIKLNKDDTFETLTQQHLICPINSLFVINDESVLNWKPLSDYYQASKKITNVLFVGESKPRREDVVIASRRSYEGLHVFLNNYYFAKEHGSLDSNIVLFLGDTDKTPAETYIQQNHDSICSRYNDKGFQFVYLPVVKEHNNELLTKQTNDNLRYKYPALLRLSDEILRELLSGFYIDGAINEQYDEIVDKLGLPFLRRPGLLRNIYQASADDYPHAFSFFSLKFTDEKIIEIAINKHLSKVGKTSGDKTICFDLGSEQKELERT